MTRFLSESLQAPEPSFRLQLRQLEQANGMPNADIRLSTEVAHATRAKLAELGLDPQDTTPKELYLSLLNRLQADDVRLTKILRTRAATHVSAEGDGMAGLVHILRESQKAETSFALKPMRFKQLIKKSAPKRVMKQLGYRSVDSLLRHEAPALILIAAQLLEGKGWWSELLASYKRLTARDFEMRPLSILIPDSSRWREFGATIVSQTKHNVYGFKELGSVVILALPAEAPAGAAMASLILALHSLSDIKAASTYLQLCQVRSDYGTILQSLVASESQQQTRLFDQAVPWRLIQRSLSRLPEALRHDLFASYLEETSLTWHSLGQAMHEIEPSLHFWQGTEHLGLLHEGKIVSMHALDVALNLCNRLPFERRMVHHFQQSLWHELLLRYLQPQHFEQSLLTALQPQVAPAFALN
jgi:hypothetical protein